jgi:EAL domain-containing protein (putative c-di-GMP-specific phosphodiesterase class I)
VVAEGIENEIRMNYLKAYDCDYGQGYYFSRPLEEDKALLYLKKVDGN